MTLQLAEAAVAADNEHIVELKVPLLSLANETAPVGTVGEFDVSVTFAMHVVGDPTFTGFCEQDTVVLVEFCEITVMLVEPWLAECVVSPL